MCQALQEVFEVQMEAEIWLLCSWNLQPIFIKSLEMDVYPVLVENPILTVLVRYGFLTIHLNFFKKARS